MRKLFCYLKGYGRECILSPLFKLTEALLELLVPLVVAGIIDEGIAHSDTGYIVWNCLLLVGLGLLGLGFSVTAQYFAARAAVGFGEKVRAALFRHISRLPVAELDRLGTATMITRLTSDTNQVQSGVNMTLRLLLRSPFVVFGAMIMAFIIDVRSAMIFVLAIPVLSVVVFGIMLLCIPLYQKVQSRLDRVLGLTRENLSGARVIRAFGREEEESRLFRESNERLTSVQKLVGRISALMNPLTYILINLAILWLIYEGALRVESGILTQGMVIALYNYMSQILVELVKLASLIILMTKSVACGNRVAAVLAIDAEQVEGKTVPEPVAGAPAVCFRNVSFRYRGAAGPALQGVNLEVLHGQTVGVIGGTGSGKSTLINLLWRAYDVTEGEILLDGRDLREYPLRDLRARIGLVPQKAELFRGSIRDNLQYGNPSASDGDLWEALRVAQAESFVREKPGGLDGMCEAGGRNFSGGQRQRLTIARALCRRPSVLILDDSASALDFATDAALRRSIRELSYAPTVFVVSQRASTLRHADCILVLDDGHVAGAGTHEELMRDCEVYREIYESQYRKEDGIHG